MISKKYKKIQYQIYPRSIAYYNNWNHRWIFQGEIWRQNLVISFHKNRTGWAYPRTSIRYVKTNNLFTHPSESKFQFWRKSLTPLRIETASLLSHTGYSTSSCRIDSNRSSSLSASNGGWPAIISYMSTPRAHQSTLAP